MAKDFVAEIVAERSRANCGFPQLVAKAEERRKVKLARGELTRILNAMDRQHGTPGKTAKAWAKRAVKRRSS